MGWGHGGRGSSLRSTGERSYWIRSAAHAPILCAFSFPVVVWQVVKNNLSPRWKAFRVSLQSLCSCDPDKLLRVSFRLGLGTLGACFGRIKTERASQNWEEGQEKAYGARQNLREHRLTPGQGRGAGRACLLQSHQEQVGRDGREKKSSCANPEDGKFKVVPFAGQMGS